MTRLGEICCPNTGKLIKDSFTRTLLRRFFYKNLKISIYFNKGSVKLPPKRQSIHHIITFKESFCYKNKYRNK